MASFLLIHGAMHGAWCWERIVPMLEAEGHQALAVDLPGLGADTTPASAVSLEGWGSFVAERLHDMPVGAILVGHSLGGMAISQAAEYASDRIGTLVYLTALLPANGQAAMEVTRGGDLPDGEVRLPILPAQDGATMTVDAAEARDYLYGDTPAPWVERALSMLTPQPLAIMAQPARLSADRFGSVPRTYIECLRDRVLPLRLQRQMQAASPCRSVFAIDTDHSPFYSAPEALAGHLCAIAEADWRSVGQPLI